MGGTRYTKMHFRPESDFVQQFKCVLCRQLITYCEERRLPASKFKYTAGKGCIICKIIRGAVETFVIDPKQRDSCYVALVGGLCLYLGPSKIYMPVDVYCLPSATCPEDWDDIDRKNNLSGSTASLDSWRQAKQWLRTCSNEHDKCRPRA